VKNLPKSACNITKENTLKKMYRKYTEPKLPPWISPVG
jgi:hypothetical protein